ADDTHPIWRKISETIEDCNPKMVGITYLTPIMHSAQKVASLVKEIDENIIVIAGGHHPSFCPEETLKSPDIDIAVRGEGEIPLLQLCNAFLSGKTDLKRIQGIHFKENGGIVGTADSDLIPDLDSLPFPARELVLNCDYSRYRLHYMITARGCPYNCTFCSDKKLWKGKVRRRSLKNVMEEMKQLSRTYDIKYVDMVDGTFTYDRRYLTDFCNAMIQEGLGIKWRCSARYDNLDRKIIDLMKKADCNGLYLGLESGSQKILNSIDKKNNGGRYRQNK
ncbi:MAG: radical SAM protein, partial [Thermodesulfobacteriota bacterium]